VRPYLEKPLTKIGLVKALTSSPSTTKKKKKKKAKRAGDVPQVNECLHSKHEALNSNTSPAKERKK
jgi:hypothetical protein